MAHQEIVQLAAIGGRRLSQTEHLHLEIGPAAPDQLLERLQDGEVEPFRVHLDEPEPRNQVRVRVLEKDLEVPPLDSHRERAAV